MHKPCFFMPNCAPKMRERQQLFFGLRLVSKEFQNPTIQTKIVQSFRRFFYQIKVCQPIGRYYSKQTVILISRRLDHFCMKRLRTLKLFKIFRTEIKKPKTIAVDVLFRAYPMVPLSCRSNLAERYR